MSAGLMLRPVPPRSKKLPRAPLTLLPLSPRSLLMIHERSSRGARGEVGAQEGLSHEDMRRRRGGSGGRREHERARKVRREPINRSTGQQINRSTGQQINRSTGQQ